MGMKYLCFFFTFIIHQVSQIEPAWRADFGPCAVCLTTLVWAAVQMTYRLRTPFRAYRAFPLQVIVSTSKSHGHMVTWYSSSA